MAKKAITSGGGRKIGRSKRSGGKARYENNDMLHKNRVKRIKKQVKTYPTDSQAISKLKEYVSNEVAEDLVVKALKRLTMKEGARILRRETDVQVAKMNSPEGRAAMESLFSKGFK